MTKTRVLELHQLQMVGSERCDNRPQGTAAESNGPSARWTAACLSAEILGVVAPDAADLMSLMDVMDGTRAASSGSVEVLGSNPAHLSDYQKRSVAFVYRQSGFPSSMRVHEVLTLLQFGVDSVPEDTQLKDAFGLNALMDRSVKQLTPTQLRCLVLYQALYGRRRLLVMDEPTAQLDAASSATFWHWLRFKQRRYGTAALILSVQLGALTADCDRVLVLEHGRLVYLQDDRGEPVGTHAVREPSHAWPMVA